MHPTQLSLELRETTSPDLTRRRWIVGLSAAGTVIANVVALYQTGIIRHLPDPPLRVFNSDKVDASNYAYKRLDTPDALLMLVNYGITAALASAGGRDRAEQQPGLAIATGVKALTDVAVAAKLGVEEWKENKALCFYCQLATVASAATAVLAFPEMLRAFRKVLGK